MTKEIKYNLVIYSVCLLIAITGIFYGNAIRSNFAFIRVWEYENILLLLIGVPFLFLQNKATLPNLWQDNISNKQRLLISAAIGAIFGLFDIIVIKIMLHPEPHTGLPPPRDNGLPGKKY